MGKTAADYPTPEARLIFEYLVPKFTKGFLIKNAQYSSVEHLGPRGVFPDINRKVGVLRRHVWDGTAPDIDATEDVIRDMIGHLFLMWALLKDEADRQATAQIDTQPPLTDQERLQEDLDTTAKKRGMDIEQDNLQVSLEAIMIDDPESVENAGWSIMPEQLKKAIRDLAQGYEIVSDPATRATAAEYVDYQDGMGTKL